MCRPHHRRVVVVPWVNQRNSCRLDRAQAIRMSMRAMPPHMDPWPKVVSFGRIRNPAIPSMTGSS